MKLLFIDIESAPLSAYVWGLWDQNISINQIIDSSGVLCFAAKWYGDDKVIFDSEYKSGPLSMLEHAHALLSEADAVVHWNGTKFDIPVLNKEFIQLRLPPPAPFKEIDLLKTSRKRFKFPSNKLDYVAQALGLGEKVKHSGFQLWVDCMNNKKSAWKEMQEYNIQDVVLLEKVYERFKPWIKHHPNVALYMDSDRPACTVCGSTRVVHRGHNVTTRCKYRRYQCKDCGKWLQGNHQIPLAATERLVEISG